tara:strand:- start:214 stop:420 length:207 start_codon:yes stop_codon:yes gene_type:complete
MGLIGIIKKLCARFTCRSTCQLGEEAICVDLKALDLNSFRLSMSDIRKINTIVSKREKKITEPTITEI